MRLRIQVSIEQDQYTPGKQPDYSVSGNLQLHEDFEVGNLQFLEVCRILGQFDELAKKVKKP
jgi:hypothetical protein